MNLVKTKTSGGKRKIEVDLRELRLRLKTLVDGCSMEVIQLAISSMLDEIDDAVGRPSNN